ncbi:MAG TPA: hypothetical protein VHO25_06695 [Polyangiaceae bacterium]|nr:hypothetical protein [Polyangiaceae bacterium]
MRTVVSSFTLLSLVSLFASCTDEDSDVSPVFDGSVMTGDDASGPSAADDASPPTSLPDASGMTDVTVAPLCEPGGEGEIVIEIAGLPGDIEAAISLQGPVLSDAGPLTLTESTTLASTASGDYEANSQNVVGEDPLVRPMFTPAAPRQLFCLPDAESHTLTVNYQRVSTSNKLWALNDVADAALVSFTSAALAGGGAADAGADAGIASDAVAGKDLAFDKSGHMWTFGPTTADPPLMRYRAAQFAGAEIPGPDRALEVNDIACLPAMRAMAFDGAGNLWLSTCGGEVVRIDKTTLETGSAQLRAVDPDVVISGITENNQDLAFDGNGNLWLADDGKVVRFNADRLAASDNDAPDLIITLRDSGDNQDLVIDFLTFDANGNLWGTDFAGNTLARIAEAELDADGDATVVAEVSLVLSVAALLNRPAFDDAGGIWISYSNGQLIGLQAATLLISSSTGSPTDPDVVLQGDSIGSIGNVAFFPAAAGLPLYHAYP